MDIIEYNKTFNCCGKVYLSHLEQVKILYYTMMYKMIKKFNDKSHTNEMFGKKDNNWNFTNHIHYFWNLLLIMRNEKQVYRNQLELGIIDEEPDNTFYRDKYDLECIRKNFSCIGVDILPLLTIIELDYIIQYVDGLDYMAIIPNTTVDPDFIVN